MKQRYMIFNSVAYHWVRKITAESNYPGSIKLTLHGDDVIDTQFNQVEITIFTDDDLLADQLIKAINSVAEAVVEKEVA